MKTWMGLALLAALAASSATAADKSGVTDKEIKISNIGPYSGPMASYAALNYGVDAYFRYINAQGGVNGRMINSLQNDNSCNEAKAIAATKKAIFEDDAFGIVGATCSGPALAAKPMVVEQNVPWVGQSGHPGLTTPVSPSMFHVIYPANAYGVEMARFVISNPEFKKVAVVQHSIEWAHSSCRPAIAAVKEAGREIVAQEALEVGSTDATAQALRVRQSGAQVILACLYQSETVALLRDMHKLRVKTPMILNFGSDFDGIVKQVGNNDALHNVFYMIFPFKAMPGEGPLKASRDILVKYLKPNELPPGGEPTSFNYYGLHGGMLFVEGLKRAGKDLSRTAWIKAMESIKDYPDGLLADNVTLSAESHVGVRKLNFSSVGPKGETVIYKEWAKPAQN